MEKKEKVSKKIKFYDSWFWVWTFSFISMLFYFSYFPLFSETPQGNGIFYVLFFIWLISQSIFIIGLIINAAKMNRIGWMLLMIFLGYLFPIIFWFGVYRKKLKKILK